jgi:hypothetical protein
MHDPEQTIEAVFRVLQDRARDVLIELRDGPGDLTAIQAWAHRHYLDCPRIVREAKELREWWDEHPKNARLLTHHKLTLFAIHSDAPGEAEWRAKKLADGLTLPQPHLETRTEYLARQRAMYDEIDGICRSRGGRHTREILPTRPSRREVEWFVDTQVRGFRGARVAGAALHRSSVTRAKHEICGVLELTPRPPEPSRRGARDSRPRRPRRDAK